MLNKLRLGMLGVAKITNDCVYVHAVCVAYMPVQVCVSVFSSDIRVFAYNYYFNIYISSLLFFIHEIYFWVTSPNPIWHQSLNSSHWVFNSNDKFI